MGVVVRKAKGRSPGLFSLLFILPLIWAAGPGELTAKEIAPAQKAGLVVAIDKFELAMKSADYEAVINASVPPALLQHIIKRAGLKGVDINKLKGLIKSQMANTLQTVKLLDFGMDKKAITHHQLADGTNYAMIPTHTVMVLSGKKLKSTGQTLGLVDEGRWFLLRVANPQQVGMVKAVYPQFKSVEFKIGAMEEVK